MKSAIATELLIPIENQAYHYNRHTRFSGGRLSQIFDRCSSSGDLERDTHTDRQTNRHLFINGLDDNLKREGKQLKPISGYS